MKKKNLPILENVEITGVAAEGKAICRIQTACADGVQNTDGIVCFVPNCVPVGAKIYVEFVTWPSGDPRYGGGDVYQLLRVISDWSDDNIILPDTQMGSVTSPYFFIYDQRAKDLVDSIGSMSFVGWGLNISKIAYK